MSDFDIIWNCCGAVGAAVIFYWVLTGLNYAIGDVKHWLLS